MPYVTITMLDRGPKKKRTAVKGVTEALVKAMDVPPEWVHVIINELPEEQIAVGGELLCDLWAKKAKPTKRRRKTKK